MTCQEARSTYSNHLPSRSATQESVFLNSLLSSEIIIPKSILKSTNISGLTFSDQGALVYAALDILID